MGMRGQYDVEPLHAAGELAIDVEAVMRKQHDDRSPVGPRLVDLLLHILFANAELPLREHPARICHCRARQCLADHGDLGATPLEHLAGLEHRLLPFVVANILGQERERRLVGDLLDAVGAIGEFPMADHGIDLQRRHDVDHVLRPGLQ